MYKSSAYIKDSRGDWKIKNNILSTAFINEAGQLGQWLACWHL